MRSIPRHLAIVPDGNRRWARARGRSTGEGHRAGIERIGHIAEAAFATGIETFTFWWGSPANLEKRSPEEVADIVAALGDWLAGPGVALVRRHGAAFEVHGRWSELCPAIEPGVEAVRNAATENARRLVLLMAYDGREEILAAAEHWTGGGLDDFGRTLWTGGLPPIDLLIRTGGEPHLSAGFMLWSLADAQFAWPDEMWPDFTEDRLAEILEWYATRERRFGA